jgi:hypothetical protein
VLAGYVAATAVLWLAVLAVLLALDPYDSGHFALLGEHGVPRFGQRLADAGLARSPAFNAAIIGNSTIQLIDPARVGAARGLVALSLAIPGTGPREQLAVARWFLRHHERPEPRGLVFGIDASWCRADGKLPLLNPFPFWLYSESKLDYALHMMRLQSIDAAGRKLKLLFGKAAPAPSNGYDDYDAGRTWTAQGFAQRLEEEGDNGAADDPPDFAALPLLARLLERLPRETGVVFVFPPRYYKALPAAGSIAARNLDLCKSNFETLAAARPQTHVIDFARPGDIATHDENFWDGIHYREPVARRMEGDIGRAFAGDLLSPSVAPADF